MTVAASSQLLQSGLASSKTCWSWRLISADFMTCVLFLFIWWPHPPNQLCSAQLLKSLGDIGFTYSEIWSSQDKKGFLRQWNCCCGLNLLQLYQQHLFCAPPDGSSVRTICCSLWFDCWATCGWAQTRNYQGSKASGGLSSHSRLWSLFVAVHSPAALSAAQMSSSAVIKRAQSARAFPSHSNNLAFPAHHPPSVIFGHPK